MKKMTLKGAIKLLREMLDIQGTDGTWNYAPYLLGMYNGMELCLALVEERDPVFREGPEVWGEDKPDVEFPDVPQYRG